MTRYSTSMSEILFQIREGFSPKEIKMAIGIAADKRYRQGNYTGAVNQIEKIKKGLSDHPQVKAVLKRLNTDYDPSIKEEDEPASPDESGMATQQLEFIKYAADEIMQHIQNGGEFPEWMQNKLSGTHEKMKGLHANINHENVQDQTEELDLDEMKMDDPKLVKAFDKMKKGDTIKLKTSSTISKGKDFVDYVVKSKNMVNKGKVEKITLVTKGNEGAVKKFLYKRDGKVTFAIGDMGASIDDIKEDTFSELEEAMLNLKLVTYQAKEALGKIRHKVAQKGGKYIISVDSNDEEDAQKAMKDHPLYVAGKLRVVPESVEEGVEPIQWPSQPLEEKLKVSDGLGAWIDDFKKSDAPQFKGKSDEEKKNMAIAAFTDAGGKLESVNEMREPYAVVDTADGNKVVGTASDEKGAKSIISTSELPPMKIKDKKTLKIVKVKKKQMIGYPIKEEEGEPQKPDSAKAVDQMRDDKKKTRIAQLQLQIAKAQETINKLNAQEKPKDA